MDSISSSNVSTPGEDPSDAIHFNPSRKRAMASFDNLVALANYQERLKDARKMVWRDRGEPVAELNGLRECLEHAATGGLRAASLAASIRAAVNLVLVLLRIQKVPRDIRFTVVRRAVFGLDTWRSGAMLGSFTAIYKFLLNAMPILFPSLHPPPPKSEIQKSRNTSAFHEDDLEAGLTSENPTNSINVPLKRRNARLSLSANAQIALTRKRTRKWHAALAGAIAGAIGIMFEKRNRRGVIAQQLFVRGLQGSYNSYTTKRNLYVPHGDVLVFALACGQIMYGFLLRPDTLPRSYTSWIGQASKVPQECVRINCGMVRDGTCNVADIDKLIARSDITASNIKDLISFRSRILSPSTAGLSPEQLYSPLYAPCSSVHPALSDCSSVPLDRFFAVAKWMLPIYAALHFIPAMVFRRKVFVQDPGKVLVKAGLGSLRSSAFLGVFVVIYQAVFCYKHKIHRYLTVLKLLSSKNPLALIPQSAIDLLTSKGSFWLTGFAAGLSLFVEEKRRRGELAMYVLPKGLESAWVMARGKGLVFRTGNLGGMWLSAIGMAMVMGTYQNDPQHLSGLVRRILYQFIGPN